MVRQLFLSDLAILNLDINTRIAEYKPGVSLILGAI